jgi:hypothetical protein
VHVKYLPHQMLATCFLSLQVLQHELPRGRPSGDRILGLLFVAANEGAPMAFRSLLNYGKQHTVCCDSIAVRRPCSPSKHQGQQQHLKRAPAFSSSWGSSC